MKFGEGFSRDVEYIIVRLYAFLVFIYISFGNDPRQNLMIFVYRAVVFLSCIPLALMFVKFRNRRRHCPVESERSREINNDD
jgi:hypothetical protein